MGLGRLNPGCGCDCGGEQCWIRYVPCRLTWQCESDARVLLNSVVISNSDSGEILEPENGTYVLQVLEGTEWQTKQSVVVDRTGPCDSQTLTCCQSLGFHDGVATSVSHVSGFTGVYAWANGSWAHNYSGNIIGNLSCRYGASYEFPKYFPNGCNLAFGCEVSPNAEMVGEIYYSTTVRRRYFKFGIITWGQPANTLPSGFPDFNRHNYCGVTVQVYEILEFLNVPSGVWYYAAGGFGSAVCGGILLRSVGGTLTRCTKYPVFRGFLSGFNDSNISCSPYFFLSRNYHLLTDCTVELSIE